MSVAPCRRKKLKTAFVLDVFRLGNASISVSSFFTSERKEARRQTHCGPKEARSFRGSFSSVQPWADGRALTQAPALSSAPQLEDDIAGSTCSSRHGVRGRPPPWLPREPQHPLWQHCVTPESFSQQQAASGCAQPGVAGRASSFVRNPGQIPERTQVCRGTPESCLSPEGFAFQPGFQGSLQGKPLESCLKYRFGESTPDWGLEPVHLHAYQATRWCRSPQTFTSCDRRRTSRVVDETMLDPIRGRINEIN